MFKMQTLWPIHSAAEPRVYASMTETTNWPPSIHQYSNMAPRHSGQNCKFLRFVCLSILNRDLNTDKIPPNMEVCSEASKSC